eukprot:CAMPEP_0185037824 /NCGR_PEP_ID=MMETSP1103-20130426/32750_1 /TAXON_ID=36769 /ORGANISM="Paraphysomonas bandaiensis, Strain Caron Lab Isolate" /LENGTH=273 /DNA_ID=CAMNT_0027575983 /DNA_START=39 /DNA_END=860 /DNA_ORIENTATION=+
MKENLMTFSSVLGVLERISSVGVVYLNEECIRVSVVTESPDTPKVFCELNHQSLFFEYRIESQSSNAILIEVEMDLLLRALASGKQVPQCQLKLVKRGARPFLCFESKAQGAIDITHDIPIRVLKPSDIIYYLPPEMSPPSVSLELPRGKLMKTIVDRISKISKYLHIDAEQSGKVIFRVENSLVTIKTYYTGLTPRFEVLNRDRDIGNSASVKLDVRRLSTVLNVQHISLLNAVMYISDDEAFVLHVTLSPNDVGTLTFYVPVVMESLGFDR